MCTVLKLREARPSLDRKEQRGSALLLVAADSFVDARRQPTISPGKKEKEKRNYFLLLFCFFAHHLKLVSLGVKSLMSFLAWLCRVVDNRPILCIL